MAMLSHVALPPISRYVFCQRCGLSRHPHRRCPDAAINPTVMIRESDHVRERDALAAALEDCATRFERCCIHSGSDKEFAAHAVENYRALVKAASESA